MKFDVHRATGHAEAIDYPRPYASDGEQRAADDLAGRCEGAGWTVIRVPAARRKIRSVPFAAGYTFWLWLLIGQAFPDQSWRLQFFNTTIGLMATIVAVGYFAPKDLMGRILGDHRHVVAYGPAGEGKARVVLATRLDSSSTDREVRRSCVVLALSLTFGLVLLAWGATGLVRRSPRAGPLLLCASWGLLVLMVGMPHGRNAPPFPGDNRTGIALLAELARTWAGGAPGHSAVQLVGIVGQSDLGRLAEELHWDRETLIVLLDAPGSGPDLTLVGTGEARDLALSAAKDLWLPARRGRWGLLSRLDLRPLTRRGIPLVILRGDQRGDHIDPAALAASAQLATEVALRWAKRHREVVTTVMA